MARALLGCRFYHQVGKELRTIRIVETEAYLNGDPASHAFRGPTDRNRSMFAPPGTLYVYRIHQVHCANIVTRPGEAVLLRAGAPVTPVLAGASGPGRLCRAMGIDLRHDGASVLDGDFGVAPRDRRVGPIVVGPRIGISRAADAPLRFALLGEAAVSRPRPWPWPGGQRSFAQL